MIHLGTTYDFSGPVHFVETFLAFGNLCFLSKLFFCLVYFVETFCVFCRNFFVFFVETPDITVSYYVVILRRNLS